MSKKSLTCCFRSLRSRVVDWSLETKKKILSFVNWVDSQLVFIWIHFQSSVTVGNILCISLRRASNLKPLKGSLFLSSHGFWGQNEKTFVLFLGDSLLLLFDPMEVTKKFENAGYYIFCCHGEIFRHENMDEQVTRIQAGVCRLRANSLLSGSS